MVIPSLAIIEDELSVTEHDLENESLANDAIRTLKINLWDHINSHLVIKPEHRIATFLDPGYKHLDLGNVEHDIIEFSKAKKFTTQYTQKVFYIFLFILFILTLIF